MSIHYYNDLIMLQIEGVDILKLNLTNNFY